MKDFMKKIPRGNTSVSHKGTHLPFQGAIQVELGLPCVWLILVLSSLATTYFKDEPALTPDRALNESLKT